MLSLTVLLIPYVFKSDSINSIKWFMYLVWNFTSHYKKLNNGISLVLSLSLCFKCCWQNKHVHVFNSYSNSFTHNIILPVWCRKCTQDHVKCNLLTTMNTDACTQVLCLYTSYTTVFSKNYIFIYIHIIHIISNRTVTCKLFRQIA